MRCRPSTTCACSSVVPTGAVMRPSAVMRVETGVSRQPADCSTKRRSRFVTMPTRWPVSSVTGTPETWNSDISSIALAMEVVGETVMGFVIMPASDRFTRSTSAAWSAIERLRCMTPMPPSRAMAIARRDSVTVSIAAETRGIASEMFRVRRLSVDASEGRISEAAGISRTSSKVRPSRPNLAWKEGKAGRGEDCDGRESDGWLWSARTSCSMTHRRRQACTGEAFRRRDWPAPAYAPPRFKCQWRVAATERPRCVPTSTRTTGTR